MAFQIEPATNLFQMYLSLAAILYYLYIGGRSYQKTCENYELNTLLIGLPLGLVYLSFSAWGAFMICAIMNTPLQAVTSIVILIGILIHTLVLDKNRILTSTKTLLGLLTIVPIVVVIIWVSSEHLVEPSIDHDISVYLGYASDILENARAQELPIFWQEISEFKVPHNNLYVSVLAWTSSVTGEITPHTDQVARAVPQIYILTLIISLLALSNRLGGGVSVLFTSLLLATMPYLYYIFTAFSVDGYYLVGLAAILYLILIDKERSITFGILLGFMGISHNLGLVYGCIILLIIFLKQPKKYQAYIPATIVILFSVLITGISYIVNEDLGFHYKYYVDDHILNVYFGDDSSWRKPMDLVHIILFLFSNFLNLLGILCISIIVNMKFSKNRSEKDLALSVLIFTSILLVVLMLYTTTKLGFFTSVGNAFVSNFRYGFGLQILLIIAITVLFTVMLNRIRQKELKYFNFLLAFSFFYFAYQSSANFSMNSFQYSVNERNIWEQRVAVCERAKTFDDFVIFTDNIAINYQCGTEFKFTFSKDGSENLVNKAKPFILITSRFEKVWKGSSYFKQIEHPQLFPEINSYDKIYLKNN
mgnify:CR=1 FL=1